MKVAYITDTTCYINFHNKKIDMKGERMLNLTREQRKNFIIEVNSELAKPANIN